VYFPSRNLTLQVVGFHTFYWSIQGAWILLSLCDPNEKCTQRLLNRVFEASIHKLNPLDHRIPLGSILFLKLELLQKCSKSIWVSNICSWLDIFHFELGKNYDSPTHQSLIFTKTIKNLSWTANFSEKSSKQNKTIKKLSENFFFPWVNLFNLELTKLLRTKNFFLFFSFSMLCCDDVQQLWK